MRMPPRNPPLPPLEIVRPPAADIPEENRGEAARRAVARSGMDIPPENRGEKARGAYEGGCVRRICLPDIPGLLPGVEERPPRCVCWSDIIVYSGATLMVLLGAVSMFRRN